MVAIIGSLVVVWLLLFVGWGNLHEVVPPGTMTQDEYVMQYMIVGAVVCLTGAAAVYKWFNIVSNYDGYGDLRPAYRKWMVAPIVVGALGLGYMMYLGAGDAGLNYVLTLLAGLIVYIIAACFGTPAAGRKIPPFG